MGIKFLCPQGHKLHVKSYLAGKRAICPKCGERVIVPAGDASVSDDVGSDSDGDILGESLSAAPGIDLLADQSVSLVVDRPVSSGTPATSLEAPPLTSSPPPPVPPAASVTPPLAAPPRDPIDEDPNAIWYVRPAAGGQFGPASGAIMRGWLAEGRVAVNSLVWRAGWPQWLSAAAVFPQLANSTPLPAASAAAMPARPVAAGVATATPAVPQAIPGAPVAEAAVTSSESLLAAAARKRRRRNDVNLMFSLGLVVVSVILVIVLIVVFRAQMVEETPADKEPAKAPPAAAN